MDPADIQAWLAVAWQAALFVGVLITVGIQIRTLFYVRKIEIQGNSIQTAMIASTERAAGLAGEQRGRAENAQKERT